MKLQYASPAFYQKETTFDHSGRFGVENFKGSDERWEAALPIGNGRLGGMQFGARYALEMIPLCFAYFMLCPDRKKIARWECLLMSFGLILNFAGACLVHV